MKFTEKAAKALAWLKQRPMTFGMVIGFLIGAVLF